MREVSTVVRMDNQGRLRVPPAVREALGLERGGLIEIVIRKIDESRKED